MNTIKNFLIELSHSEEQNNFFNQVIWANLYSYFNFYDKNSLEKCRVSYPNVAEQYEYYSRSIIYRNAYQIFEKHFLPLIVIPDKVPKIEFIPPLLKINPDISANIRTNTEILPEDGKRNILITSALPYVNNVPHLGNIIGCVLSADVYARYCRLRGYNTLYICGTDEYGTTTETKALEERLTCQQICDKYFEIHKRCYEWFNISFDKFGRTATEHQTKIAQDIFLKLKNNGFLEKGTINQLFCEKCHRFLADRYVEGICPYCHYNDARGDQCDICGHVLNAEELINPRCKLCSCQPVIKNSDHMFLKLPELQDECKAFVEKSYENGKWSSNSYKITQGWFKESLKNRCITRDLIWGTPVPLEEMKKKVFYVWFDAPIGYLSITSAYTKKWELWWKNPENVQLYQFMGKDNVPFHTVIFPSSLIGTKDNYTLLHHVSTTEYLNYEGGKFSKSRGTGIFGNNVMETEIPSSVWRYYLLSNRPETNDSQFTWEDLRLKNNSELLANLGNFVNRTLKFLKINYLGQVPQSKFTPADDKLIDNINLLLKEYVQMLESVKLKDGLKITMEISRICNLYLAEEKLGNFLFESDKERCGTVIAISTNVIYYLATLLYPYMPSVSESILEQLYAPLRKISESFTMDILPGHVIGTPSHLFYRLNDGDIERLKKQYSGNNGK